MKEIEPNKIKGAIVSIGHTQRSFAKKVGLTESTLSRFFNGTAETSYKTVNKIIRAYNNLKPTNYE